MTLALVGPGEGLPVLPKVRSVCRAKGKFHGRQAGSFIPAHKCSLLPLHPSGFPTQLLFQFILVFYIYITYIYILYLYYIYKYFIFIFSFLIKHPGWKCRVSGGWNVFRQKEAPLSHLAPQSQTCSTLVDKSTAQRKEDRWVVVCAWIHIPRVILMLVTQMSQPLWISVLSSLMGNNSQSYCEGQLTRVRDNRVTKTEKVLLKLVG